MESGAAKTDVPRCQGWTVDTLLALMDERDRRYTQQFNSAREAVLLAKQVADASKGTVNIALVIGVLGLALSLFDKFGK